MCASSEVDEKIAGEETHSFRVAIMTTEPTVVSFVVVVVKSGRIHSTKVSSTTCMVPAVNYSIRMITRLLTYILMDALGEGLGNTPVVDGVAVTDDPHYQSLLPFMSNEEGTKFFGVCVNAWPIIISVWLLVREPDLHTRS